MVPPDAVDEDPGAVTDGDCSGRPNRRGTRRRRRLLAVGAIVLVSFVSVAIWQAASRSTSEESAALIGPSGRSAPEFSLPSLHDPGHNISLSSFRGKPLVVNFWASWCIPCRTEMPLLETAFTSEHKKVNFVGIDANDTSSAAHAFLAEVHVIYPAVSDSNGAVAMKYGLYGLPTTVFVSPTGKIIGRHVGQLHADTLRAALSEAFPDA